MITENMVSFKLGLPARTNRVCIIRRLPGLGDIVSLLPVITYYLLHGKEVHLVSYPKYGKLINRIKPAVVVHERVPVLPDCSYYNLDSPCPAGLYERNAGSNVAYSRIELFGLACGIQPQYLFAPSIEYKHRERRFIGIVLHATYKYRSPTFMMQIARFLKKYGVKLVGENLSPVEDMTVTQCEVHELIDELAECKAIISPDTGILHLAAAMRLPVYAIFGPTDPKIVCKYYDTVSYHVPKCPKHPCWHSPCTGSVHKISPCLNLEQNDLKELSSNILQWLESVGAVN